MASFLSATVLPFSSEAVLSGLLVIGSSPVLCLAFATLGNTLGGVTCYWLGRCGKTEWLEKYMGVSLQKVESIRSWVKKRGALVAFFSFLPFFGDLLIIALGFLRANFLGVTFFMFLGKLLRYIVCFYLVDFIVNGL